MSESKPTYTTESAPQIAPTLLGFTQRELQDFQRILSVLGRKALSDIAEELEQAAACGHTTDVTIGFDENGRAVVIGTYCKRSLVR